MAQPLLELLWSRWWFGFQGWCPGCVLTSRQAASELEFLPTTVVAHIQVVAAVSPAEAGVLGVKTRRPVDRPIMSPTAQKPDSPMITMLTSPQITLLTSIGGQWRWGWQRPTASRCSHWSCGHFELRQCCDQNRNCGLDDVGSPRWNCRPRIT